MLDWFDIISISTVVVIAVTFIVMLVRDIMIDEFSFSDIEREKWWREHCPRLFEVKKDEHPSNHPDPQ